MKANGMFSGIVAVLPSLLLACGDEPPAGPATGRVVAHARADRHVIVGQEVILDASESTGPAGATLAFAWTLVAPQGSVAALAGAETAVARFTPDEPGDYVATVRVRAGHLEASAQVTLTAGRSEPPVLAAPEGVEVEAGNRTARVRWKAVEGAVRYAVELAGAGSVRSLEADGGGCVARAEGAPCLELVELVNCADYRVVVRAVERTGREGEPSEEVTFRPALPATSVVARGGHGIIELRLEPVENATAWRVHFGTKAGGPYDGTSGLFGPSPLVAAVEAGEPVVRVEGLAPEQKTFLAVEALDGDCAGERSNEVVSRPYPWTWATPLPTGNDLHAVSCRDAACLAAGAQGTIVALDGGPGRPAGRRNGGTALDYVALAIASETVAWALTESGVRRSSDGGATWRDTAAIPPRATASGPAKLRGLAAADATSAFAVGDAGTIVRTTDGGATWTTLIAGTSADLFGVARAGAAHVVVGAQGKVLLSADGSSFAQGAAGGEALYAVACAGPQACVAVGAKGVVVATSNGGESWEVRREPEEGAPDLRAVALDGAYGLAGGARGTLLESDDGGATWTAVELATLEPIRGVVTGEEPAAVGGGGLVLRKTRGACPPLASHCPAVWRRGFDRTGLTDIAALHFPAEGQGRVITTGGTTHVVDDWQGDRSGGVTASLDDVRAVHFAGDVAYAVGAAGGVSKSTDGGATWQRLAAAAAGDADLAAVHCLDASRCFVAGNEVVLATDDGGASWRALNPHGRVRAVRAHDPQKLVILSDASQVAAYTLDGGAVWTSAALGGGVRLIGPRPMALHFESAEIGFIAGGGCDPRAHVGGGRTETQAEENCSGLVFSTADGGKTWAHASLGATGLLEALVRLPDGSLLAGGQRATLAARIAERWEVLAPAGHRGGIRAMAVDPAGRVWIGGREGHLLWSDTGGR